MLIDIESYFGNYLLHGKKLKISEVQAFMKECEHGKDFVTMFCARFGYEILPYEEYLLTDLTIDPDTYRIVSHKN